MQTLNTASGQQPAEQTMASGEAAEAKPSPLASPTLLRKIDQLRAKNAGTHVSLPQLVVVGDQSSGKSSLLENITGIPFPRDAGLCTRYATQITSRRDDKSLVEVTIIPGPNASEEHKQHLQNFSASIPTGKTFLDEFGNILKKVSPFSSLTLLATRLFHN
jgi:hypothetical protein